MKWPLNLRYADNTTIQVSSLMMHFVSIILLIMDPLPLPEGLFNILIGCRLPLILDGIVSCGD